MEPILTSILRLLSLSALLCSVSGTWKGEGQPLEYFILEELPEGTLIGNVAVDYKLTEKFNSSVLQSLSFEIDPLQSTKQHLFAIGSKSAIVSTTVKIDRDAVCPGENVCLAWLHIKVLPQGITKDIRIMLEIMDRNDHAPRFDDKMADINFLESAKIGTLVELPTATDEDSGKNGIHQYELVSNSDLFQLDVIKEEHVDKDTPSTKLRLKVAGNLNRDEASKYLLRLIAHDGGNPSRSGTLLVNVTIEDVNDHDPRFDNATYIASVRENAPTGTLVTKVKARDFDLGENAAITYTLNIVSDEKFGSLFNIDSQTGAITLKRALDFEKGSMYLLVITATDNGQVSKSAEATVIVRVLDENDNSPVIKINDALTSDGAIEASEDLTTGSFVAHLTVSDQDGGNNGRVECSINSQVFAIEKVYQAQFRIITRYELDRESRESYSIVVVCHDLGDEPNMATQTIEIAVKDVNDNAPIFSQEIYHSHLAKDRPSADALLQVKATDPDQGPSGQVNYKVHANAADMFAIHQTSGEITIKTKIKLDGASQMQFRVIAYDRGSPSLSATATVVVNNAPLDALATPEFALHNYEFGVFENVPSDTEVGTVALKVPPPTEIAVNDYEFSFDDTSSDVHSFFSIDSTSGQMKTKTTFDREEQSVYYMAVKAVSKSHPYLSATVSLTVYIADKNDNAPVVTYPTQKNHTVSVRSNAPLDHPLAKVKALDPDLGGNSKITFAITTGNPDKTFKISTSTGLITLNADLSKIMISKFTLQILVSDTGYPRYSTPTTLVVLVNRTPVPGVGESHPGSALGQGMVDSSHATIVVAVTAASLITVFLVLFGVMVFLIWRRMQPAGDKHHHQGDKYCYSNMESETSGSMIGAPSSHRHSTRSRFQHQRDLVEGAQVQGAVPSGGTLPEEGTDECRQIHHQQPGPSQHLARPRSNIIEGKEYCLNTDLEKQRLPHMEKNMLMQATCNRASSPSQEPEVRCYNQNELSKPNNVQAASISDTFDERAADSDESFVRGGTERYDVET